jgi:hypothetical protein
VPRPIVLGVRLSEEDHAALGRAAEDDQRSMSALASKVLVEWLRAHGYASPTPKTAAPRRQGPRGKAKVAPAALRQARKTA